MGPEPVFPSDLSRSLYPRRLPANRGFAAIQETQVQFLDGEDPLEKEMTIHSSILAWEIPWTEVPDDL